MATVRPAVTCLGLMALGLLAAAPAGAAARDRLTFMLNFVPDGIHTAFLVAGEKGFYDRANLDVTPEGLAVAKGMEIVSLYLSDWGVDLYGLALLTSEKMLHERRDVVRRWTDATLRAIAWSVENPEQAVAIFVKKNPAVSPELALEHWRIVVDHLLTPVAKEQGIGFMTEEKMRRTRDTLLRYHTSEGEIPLNDLFTNEFQPKLSPRRPVP